MRVSLKPLSVIVTKLPHVHEAGFSTRAVNANRNWMPLVLHHIACRQSA